MRGMWSSLLAALGLLRRRANLLCVGLDNSGKSTAHEEVVPTVGFSVEMFERGKVSFTIFDMSGQGKYRDLWRHYFSEADGIIFVIDSADRDRIVVAREELALMLENKVLAKRPIPVLFLANKMDLENGLSPVECSEALGLDRIRDRAWNISACNALTGEGLEAGLEWIIDMLRQAPPQ
nr:ADP-ribosylation factor-like protein 6 [Polyrhizophydium stewartii]